MKDASKLNAFEWRVLDMLLAGDHPVLVQLRKQCAAASVVARRFTGVGFFVDISVDQHLAEPVIGRRSFRFGDIYAEGPQLPDGGGGS
jgi:hypothetical protein